MTSKIVYKGDLRTLDTHVKSGAVIETDAPVDNHGKGEMFSPTDLVATALGACMMTVMGIAAADKNISLEQTTLSIEKIMGTAPRRIVAVKIDIQFPDNDISPEDRKLLEHRAINCPVAKSLHPDIEQLVSFNW